MILSALGAFLFATLFWIRVWSLVHSFNVYVLLLAIQAGTTAVLLVLRRKSKTNIRWQEQLLAWLSATLPLALAVPENPGFISGLLMIFSMAGLFMNIWSMITLGLSFGIAPADRGLVVRGPYEYVRHPMYFGEIYSLGFLILAALPLGPILIIHNVLTFIAFLASIVLRIQLEEEKISNYEDYANRIPWRLIPEVW